MLLLGCIADDFTGATDLANNLVRAGMRVVQAIGVPRDDLESDVDAVVVALKSRTIAAGQAIAQSLEALRWLRGHGARQIYFKYCSTFDSTPDGNIGPVTEALMDAFHTDFTIATPAFPDNARTVFKGYLFVGDVPLNESGMQDHPLTPMRDANLVRVLQAQCRRKVGLIDYQVVGRGAEAIRARIDALRKADVGIAVVDAISNADLDAIAPALAGLPLVTAGSGLAVGLPRNFGVAPSNRASALPAATGYAAIVSGSCSVATNRQVRTFIDHGGLAYRIDLLKVALREDIVRDALRWAESRLAQGPVLIYSTTDAAGVKRIQEQFGVAGASDMLERALGAITRGLVGLGVRRLILAGGETAGASVQALNVTTLRIGPQIDPGVPWCHASLDEPPPTGVHLALKSGNFGSDDFFSKAFAVLQ